MCQYLRFLDEILGKIAPARTCPRWCYNHFMSRDRKLFLKAILGYNFSVDQSVVSRYIRNLFKDGEIKEKSNMQKMHIANSEEKRTYGCINYSIAQIK